jgi:hypothetical protein
MKESGSFVLYHTKKHTRETLSVYVYLSVAQFQEILAKLKMKVTPTCNSNRKLVFASHQNSTQK